MSDSANKNTHAGADNAPASNFLRNIIDADLKKPEYQVRPWGGRPGGADAHEGAPADPASIRVRFQTEPNGSLPVGHAKAI